MTTSYRDSDDTVDLDKKEAEELIRSLEAQLAKAKKSKKERGPNFMFKTVKKIPSAIANILDWFLDNFWAIMFFVMLLMIIVYTANCIDNNNIYNKKAREDIRAAADSWAKRNGHPGSPACSFTHSGGGRRGCRAAKYTSSVSCIIMHETMPKIKIQCFIDTLKCYCDDISCKGKK